MCVCVCVCLSVCLSVCVSVCLELQDNVRNNKYEVQKFQREAYLLRSLLHPGVLRVFGFCKVRLRLRLRLRRRRHLRLALLSAAASSKTNPIRTRSAQSLQQY